MIVKNEDEVRVDFGFDVTAWRMGDMGRTRMMRGTDIYGRQLPHCWGIPAYWAIEVAIKADPDLAILGDAIRELRRMYAPWDEYSMHEVVDAWYEFADAAWELGIDIDVHTWDDPDYGDTIVTW